MAGPGSRTPCRKRNVSTRSVVEDVLGWVRREQGAISQGEGTGWKGTAQASFQAISNQPNPC